jgi:hypothetical protein
VQAAGLRNAYKLSVNMIQEVLVHFSMPRDFEPHHQAYYLAIFNKIH